jgi:4'-phosphopantetheinyl transferase
MPDHGRSEPVDIRLWTIDLDQGRDALDRLRGHLSPREAERAGRFHSEADRARFLVGRGALREILAREAGVGPGSLAIQVGPQGKPHLIGPAADLRFNLSHARGLAVLAVAWGREVGVDVEAVRPMGDLAGLVARFFSPREREEFARVEPGRRAEVFFRTWTRKEAYVKAIGAGLSMPLDDFDVPVEPADPPGVLRVEGRPGEPSRWAMRDLEPGPEMFGTLVAEGTDVRMTSMKFEI